MTKKNYSGGTRFFTVTTVALERDHIEVNGIIEGRQKYAL